jgi:two-component system sensor histidine kinase/response regulator
MVDNAGLKYYFYRLVSNTPHSMKLAEQKTNGSSEKFRFFRSFDPSRYSQDWLDDIYQVIASGITSFTEAIRYFFIAFKEYRISIGRKNRIFFTQLQSRAISLHNKICSFGVTDLLDEPQRRRLALLNQINILHFITCLLIPFLALIGNKGISFASLLISLAPVFVSTLVLALNAFRKYNSALLSYFILYPFVTCLIYMDGMNLGMELYFIMYGILAVFFLKEISHMILSVSFSMISYFMLVVVIKNYSFQLKIANPGFYFFNQVVAIIFIFYGLYLIMKENAGYQGFILQKNDELKQVNLEIEQKNEIISDKAKQLENQTVQLTALNSFQTKLFSIISHDLRAPVYALRDLFNNAAEKNITTEEVKELIPDAANDLTYTATLMENLLQWAKSQLQAGERNPQGIDAADLIAESVNLLRLQADTKKVHIVNMIDRPVHAYADKDMVSIVIRNLLSNAIKFTPAEGKVVIEAHERDSFVEVFVKDNGTGMSMETLQKINANNFFTTKGTANESGTGLGLMLCKEFLSKNGGRMFVESTEGKGSVFSFTLPAHE